MQKLLIWHFSFSQRSDTITILKYYWKTFTIVVNFEKILPEFENFKHVTLIKLYNNRRKLEVKFKKLQIFLILKIQPCTDNFKIRPNFFDRYSRFMNKLFTNKFSILRHFYSVKLERKKKAAGLCLQIPSFPSDFFFSKIPKRTFMGGLFIARKRLRNVSASLFCSYIFLSFSHYFLFGYSPRRSRLHFHIFFVKLCSLKTLRFTRIKSHNFFIYIKRA